MSCKGDQCSIKLYFAATLLRDGGSTRRALVTVLALCNLLMTRCATLPALEEATGGIRFTILSSERNVNYPTRSLTTMDSG